MSRSKKTTYGLDEFDNYMKNKKRSKSFKPDPDPDFSSESGFTSSDESDIDKKFEYYKYKRQLKKKQNEDTYSTDDDDDLVFKKSRNHRSKKEKQHRVNHLTVNYSYFTDQIINSVYNPVNIVNVTSLLTNNITIFLTNKYNDGDMVSFFFYGNTVENVVIYTNHKINGYEPIDNTDRLKYSIKYTNELKLLLVKNTWFFI